MRHLAVLLCLVLVGCGGSVSSASRQPSVDPGASTSPAEPEILYVGDRDGTPRLFVIGVDGAPDPVPLGGEPMPTTIADYAPSWSPDGTLVAHHRLTRDGRDDLVVIEAASGTEIASVEVGFPPSGSATVSWSPDSSRVAYWSTGDASNEIRVLDIATNESTIVAGNPAADRHPAWEPSGHRLAFWSDRSGRGEIWVVSMDGDVEPVAIAEVGPASSPPAWSPDGAFIAVTVQVGPDRWMTELLTPDGAGAEVLPAAGSSVNAAWSPDGTQLAYWDVGGTRAQLLLLERGDDQPRPLGPAVLTSGIVLASHPTTAWPPAPSWSPSGDQLVAELRQGGGMASLLAVTVASNAWRILDRVGGNAFSPSWKPRQP